MKKVVFLTVLIALLLVGCGAVNTSQAVKLPEVLVAFIGMAAMTALTAAAKWLFDQFGIDLQDQFAELAAVVASIVVVAINYGLGLVPAAYDNWLNAIIAFLVILVGGTGIYSIATRKKRRASKG